MSSPRFEGCWACEAEVFEEQEDALLCRAWLRDPKNLSFNKARLYDVVWLTKSVTVSKISNHMFVVKEGERGFERMQCLHGMRG